MTVEALAEARPAPRKRKLTRAEQNIKWLEKLVRVPDGQFTGQKLVIAPYMREDFKAIYDNPAGTRTAIISRGRKNSKTTEAALIMLLHLAGPEHVQNGQIYSTAKSRDQAAIVFGLAAKMVRMSPVLFGMIKIREASKEMTCPALGTFYKALSAESATAFGKSPSLHIADEAGLIRGPRSTLFEAMETATASQANPLTVVISTQAPSNTDLLSNLIDDAKQVDDPKIVLRMDSAPPDMDPFSDEAIRAANPAFDLFMNQDEVRSMARIAKRMPAREAEYRNLVLNQRVEMSNPFVTASIWQKNASPAGNLQGRVLYGGLDLSAVSDLTALVLMGQISDMWHVQPTFWLPEDGLVEKAARDKVPYDLWHEQGFLETTPGASVSYEHVARQLRTLFDTYTIAKIGFDRWNMKHLIPWLLKAGFSQYMIEERFVEFGQGTQSMSPALRDLEGMLVNGRIAHGGHPVLAMCASCAVVEGKDEANRKLSKNKSSGRIDGLVALAMAVGVAPLARAMNIESMIA